MYRIMTRVSNQKHPLLFITMKFLHKTLILNCLLYADLNQEIQYCGEKETSNKI